MRFRTSILTAAVAAASIGIAGCGGGGGYSSGMNQSTGGGGGANVNAVSIVDYSFSPPSLTVKAGTAVTWTNMGTVAHTTTSDNGTWSSGQLSGSTPGGPYGGGSAGASYSFTFMTAGTFTYHCSNHTNMTGTITVTP